MDIQYQDALMQVCKSEEDCSFRSNLTSFSTNLLYPLQVRGTDGELLMNAVNMNTQYVKIDIIESSSFHNLGRGLPLFDSTYLVATKHQSKLRCV